LGERESVAVGSFGAIYHTTDGGRSWETRESGTKNPLFDVDFADGRTGWIVGKSATILHTADGGRTWKPQKGPVAGDKHLFNVDVIDARTAWAVGDWGAIAMTRDAGATWVDRSLGTVTVKTEQAPGRETATITDDVILYDVSFPDAQHGFIGGEFGTVLATSDGGETWEKRETGTEKTLFGLHFSTPERGWAVGIDGLLLQTRDGGRTWTFLHGRADVANLEDVGFLETLKNPGLYAVSVVGQQGVVIGDTGTIYTTADGGDNWVPHVLPEKDRLVWMRGVSLGAGTRGFVVGANGFVARLERDQIVLPDGSAATAATP
jgi:photosystem II stability/assembly factor-like uncharacterized protein